jgi:dihydrolipoamide dehydrogenase
MVTLVAPGRVVRIGRHPPGAHDRARRLGSGGPVVAALADGRDCTGDEILVAVGRRPATIGIGLEHAGLEPGRPVRVDWQLRAVGVHGGVAVRDRRLQRARALHAHGKYHGRIAAAAILGRERREPQ